MSHLEMSADRLETAPLAKTPKPTPAPAAPKKTPAPPAAKPTPKVEKKKEEKKEEDRKYNPPGFTGRNLPEPEESIGFFRTLVRAPVLFVWYYMEAIGGWLWEVSKGLLKVAIVLAAIGFFFYVVGLWTQGRL